jgi:hypothetical protein
MHRFNTPCRVRFIARGGVPAGWIPPVQFKDGQRVAVRDRSAYVRGATGVAEFVRIDLKETYDELGHTEVTGSRSVWVDPFNREYPTLKAALAEWPDRRIY